MAHCLLDLMKVNQQGEPPSSLCCDSRGYLWINCEAEVRKLSRTNEIKVGQ